MKTLAGPAIIFLPRPEVYHKNEQKLIFVGFAIVKFLIQTVFEITSSTNPYFLASSADM